MEKAIGSKTAVIASGFNHDHMTIMDTDLETTMKHKPTGSQQSIISNRVSWFYDFGGPSITIDTACSSGVVSVHLAAQSLKSGDSEMVGNRLTLILFFASFMVQSLTMETGRGHRWKHHLIRSRSHRNEPFRVPRS